MYVFAGWGTLQIGSTADLKMIAYPLEHIKQGFSKHISIVSPEIVKNFNKSVSRKNMYILKLLWPRGLLLFANLGHLQNEMHQLCDFHTKCYDFNLKFKLLAVSVNNFGTIFQKVKNSS